MIICICRNIGIVYMIVTIDVDLVSETLDKVLNADVSCGITSLQHRYLATLRVANKQLDSQVAMEKSNLYFSHT